MNKKLTIVCAGFLSLLVAAASVLYVLYRPGFVYRVYVDGEDVGTIAELTEYTGILEKMLAQEEAEAGLTLDFDQELAAQKEFQWNPSPDAEKVETAIRGKVSYITVGWAVVVKGERLLWTASREQAEEVLDGVAAHYTNESPTRQLISYEIVDDVELVSEEVLPEDITDVDSAISFIIQGREKIETYVVDRGDSVWSIARSANISQSELREANPVLAETSVLKTGQVLNLVVAEPKITVRTVEQVQAYESIPFSTSYQNSSDLWYYQSKTMQKGVSGKREVTYEVEYINGVEDSRKTVKSRVDKEPVTRIIKNGISRWPSGATGMFRWPLNKGEITDRFGAYQYWRYQRHTAVDIGAPKGTTIYAAASGTVSTATYGNSYGNYVIIDHGNGYSTLYAHASSLSVRAGQSVSKGQAIAAVGSTGDSTGNHLHFEIRRNGTPIDPLQFFRP